MGERNKQVDTTLTEKYFTQEDYRTFPYVVRFLGPYPQLQAVFREMAVLVNNDPLGKDGRHRGALEAFPSEKLPPFLLLSSAGKQGTCRAEVRKDGRPAANLPPEIIKALGLAGNKIDQWFYLSLPQRKKVWMLVAARCLKLARESLQKEGIPNPTPRSSALMYRVYEDVMYLLMSAWCGEI